MNDERSVLGSREGAGEHMFQRFTDKARMALALANRNAQRLGHDFIGPEDILVGLLGLESSVAVAILTVFEVQLANLRRELEETFATGSNAHAKRILPADRSSKAVIEQAIREAQGLGHDYVGTEHVLLGLLERSSCASAEILKRHGVTAEEVRRTLRAFEQQNSGGSQER